MIYLVVALALGCLYLAWQNHRLQAETAGFAKQIRLAQSDAATERAALLARAKAERETDRDAFTAERHELLERWEAERQLLVARVSTYPEPDGEAKFLPADDSSAADKVWDQHVLHGGYGIDTGIFEEED